jgi:hypothetical protein
LAVLMAVALGAGLVLAAGSGGRLRWPVRAGAAVAAVALLAVFTGQSFPLRQHREHGGSFETTQRIAAAAGGRQGVFLWEQPSAAAGGRQGVFLWEQPSAVASIFGSAVWLQQDQVSVLVPRRPDPDYVRSFVRGFPGQPVFVVARGHGLPRAYASLDLRPVDRVSYVMPVWEETRMRRPASATGVPLRFSIWRVGTGAGSG